MVVVVVNKSKKALLSSSGIIFILYVLKYFTTDSFFEYKNIFQILTTAILFGAFSYKFLF
ncbi:hypothetical protein BG55_01755 [Erwinia mallotivora]|uniref:Uncharacterized protein n=1 Tax=Erwinia mallotivora TaxID=69222 RepID=A0A014NCR7_9GAMM|nr:hypothetical protein BG55_01755 [Erwinia mallotivora]